MITHLAWSAIEPKINKRSNDFLGNTLFQHQGTIKDVIEINLAQGFANFAKEIKANRENIPNFDHQPTLVNMISVLLHRSSNHIDAAKLRTIEQKYRKSYLEILDQTKIFCSNIPNYQELIKEYKQSSDPVIRQRIVQALLPGYVKERDQMSTLFLTKIDELKNHEQELRDLFDQVTDDILTELFPNKVNDLKFPGDILTYIPYLPDYVYNNYIKAPLTDLLLTTYIPLENNTLRNEGWENNLKKHIGNQDLSPIIQSPAALLLGYTTNYVQTNPNAVGMAANFLGSLMESSRREIAGAVPNNNNNNNDPGENRKKDDLFSQLSQEQLANWCVESIQAMLHTQDPQLLGFGEFVKQVFNNLTLALMANGTAIVFPEGERINEDHFLKVLLDRIVEKVKLVNADEAITDDFWKDFVGKLPLPPLIQNHLIPLLIDQTKALQEVFFETTALSGMAENAERDTVEIIRHYKGGEQILSIIDTVSNQIVDSIFKKRISAWWKL